MAALAAAPPDSSTAPAPSGGDDASALNAWLAGLGATGSGILGRGVYQVGQTLRIPAGVSLGGTANFASTLKKRAPCAMLSLGAGARVCDIVIDGNRLAGSDVTIADGADAATVDHCRILRSGASAVLIGAARNVTLYDLWIEDTIDRSIYVNNVAGCDDLLVERCRIFRPGQDGIVVHGGQSMSLACRSPRIVNNFVSLAGMASTKEQLAIECWGGVLRPIVAHNHVIGPDSGGGFYGISLDMTRGGIVDANVVESNVMVGVELADSESCQVIGNQISGATNQGPSGIARAISVTNGPSGGSSGWDNIIQGNAIVQAENGVFAGNDSVGLSILGNRFIDCTNGIYLEGGVENSGNCDDAEILDNAFRLRNLVAANAGVKLRFANRARISNNRFSRRGSQSWVACIVLDSTHTARITDNVYPTSVQFLAQYNSTDGLTVDGNQAQ